MTTSLDRRHTPDESVTSRDRWILGGIIAVAAGLRLTGAAHGALMYDEVTHLAVAQTIDLRPSSLHLAWRAFDHPPISVYVVRLSSVLFGDSDFGIRVLHAVVGALSCLAMFLLTRRVFSTRAALISAALLALDQFHLTWSYFIVPEVLLLLFGTLTVWQFFRATDQPSVGRVAR